MQNRLRERTATVIGRLPDEAGRSRAPMSVGRTTVDDERSACDARQGRDPRPRPATAERGDRGARRARPPGRGGRDRQDPAAARRAGARGRAGLRAVVRRGLAPGRRALRRAAPGPRSRDGAVGRSRRGRPREGAADRPHGRDRPVPALRRRAPPTPARGPGRGGPPGVAGRGGTDAAGARGPPLERRAEPGDRRAPGAAAALPAALRGRHAAHRRAPPGRPGPGLAGPDAAPEARRRAPAGAPRPRRSPSRWSATCSAGAVRRAAWSSSCTSAPEGCRCTSRSSSAPPPRGT